MNYMKRATTSIFRKPAKSLILLGMVFILGTLISGAVSIGQAVRNTEANLFARLPGVLAIDIDQEMEREHRIEVGSSWATLNPDPIEVETLRQIGGLPYVRSFDYTISFGFMNRVLLPFREEPIPHSGAEHITLTGVHNPNIADMEAGLIELTRGRTFEEGETHVAVVSEAFARANNLVLGSMMELESIAVDINTFGSVFNWPVMLADYVLREVVHEVEIVGLFDVPGEVGVGNPWREGDGAQQLQNRIYLPPPLIETMMQFERDFYLEHFGHLSDIPPETQLWSIYLLHDPRDLAAFIEAANDLLPPGWAMADLSSNFGNLISSMDSLLWIADQVLWASVGATVLILGLLIALFLRDRRHEIGTYIALGEKKSRILFQILSEVLSVSAIAIALSLVSGTLISSTLSRQMLQQDLAERIHEQAMLGMDNNVPQALEMFNPGQMSLDEMLLAYDTSLNTEAIIMLLAIGLGTVVLSTVGPLIYVMGIEPRKILL